MDALPTGTVTLLFSDIEGSTLLLQRLGPAYAEVLAAHHTLVRAALAAHGGREVDTAGDGFFAAFARATDALAAAAAIQRGLAAHPWPEGEAVRIRMGLHTGEPVPSPGGYTGLDVHRAARIMGAGWGGQVLISAATEALVRDALPEGVALRPLGEHRLKDLHAPEALFQLVVAGLPADFPPPRAASAHPHNLPTPPTALLGREAAVDEAEALFASGARLVTLTGPGGTGKTRLAVEAAARLLEEVEGGAWFVPLAAVADPALVLPAVADVLGAKEQAGRPTRAAVTERIGGARLLLVLDNFEQVLDAAPEVAHLLSACPGLRVIATSRAPLRLQGERELPVLPLDLPDPARVEGATISQYAAVRLFIDRATAVRPDFRVDNRNAPAVAEICARLDGLPLAIELAAARVRLFPPEALLARLARPLELLRGGARDLPDRHQTLRDTIRWSYDLLPPAQQRALRRLGVFVGGFTLEAAEALLGPDAPDDVLALLDQSLLHRDADATAEPRFRMLETVREFALDALEAAGETATVRDAHARAFLALTEDAAPHLTGPDQRAWLDRLDAEQANLRAALAHFEEAGALDEALRMGGPLGRFWLVRGHLGEGYRRLLRLVELSAGLPPSPGWIAVRSAAGIMAEEAGAPGDVELALRLLEETVAACRAAGDRAGLATALGHLGYAYIDLGDAERARGLCEEALALQREVGDRRGVAVALQNLGLLATLEGRFDDAEAFLLEGREERRAHGEQRGYAFVHHWMAYNSLLRGRPAEAAARAEEGLRLIRPVGDPQVEAVLTTDAATAAVDLGRPADALPLFDEALRLWAGTGNESGIAYAEMGRGTALFELGRLDEARAVIDAASVRVSHTQFQWGVGHARLLFGEAHLAAGDFDAARDCFEAARAYNAGIRYPRGVADALLGLGAVAMAAGRAEEAAAALAEGLRILAACGADLCPRHVRRYGPALAAAGFAAPAAYAARDAS